MSWRTRYYEDGYLRRWTLGPPEASERREAAAMLRLSGRAPPVRILDVGCGHGRYSGPLAEFGAEVVAMDASRVLLQRAVSQLGYVGGRVLWVQGDMSALPFRGFFDLVLLKDAFGYFDKEGDDLPLLSSINDVTASGGHVMLRNPNAASIRARFRPHREERRAGCLVSIHSRLDETGRWLEEELVITDDLGEHRYQRCQRLYTASELTELLGRSGYSNVQHFADFEGEPHNSGASHIVTVAQRAS